MDGFGVDEEGEDDVWAWAFSVHGSEGHFPFVDAFEDECDCLFVGVEFALM